MVGFVELVLAVIDFGLLVAGGLAVNLKWQVERRQYHSPLQLSACTSLLVLKGSIEKIQFFGAFLKRSNHLEHPEYAGKRHQASTRHTSLTATLCPRSRLRVIVTCIWALSGLPLIMLGLRARERLTATEVIKEVRIVAFNLGSSAE